MAAVSAVNPGISKLTLTWLWAPRLYSSSGRALWTAANNELGSVRSP